MAREQKLVNLEFDLLVETEKAFRVSVMGNEAWLPKSQVEDNGDGTITLPERLAIEKGFV